VVQRQTASSSPCMRTRLAVSQLAGRVSMELASYPFVADSPELIGRQLRRRFVAIIHAPDVPITKIVEQFLVLLVTHIARPYDAGVIDVRLVVDPLAIHIVVGVAIRDDYEMWTRETLQLSANCWRVENGARPGRLYSTVRMESG